MAWGGHRLAYQNGYNVGGQNAAHKFGFGVRRTPMARVWYDHNSFAADDPGRLASTGPGPWSWIPGCIRSST